MVRRWWADGRLALLVCPAGLVLLVLAVVLVKP